MIRTSRRGYFLTENYYIGSGGDDVMLFFVGGRRLIKNSGIDFGVLIPTETGGQLVAMPWLGVTFPFGNTINNGQRKSGN